MSGIGVEFNDTPCIFSSLCVSLSARQKNGKHAVHVVRIGQSFQHHFCLFDGILCLPSLVVDFCQQDLKIDLLWVFCQCRANVSDRLRVQLAPYIHARQCAA